VWLYPIQCDSKVHHLRSMLKALAFYRTHKHCQSGTHLSQLIRQFRTAIFILRILSDDCYFLDFVCALIKLATCWYYCCLSSADPVTTPLAQRSKKYNNDYPGKETTKWTSVCVHLFFDTLEATFRNVLKYLVCYACVSCVLQISFLNDVRQVLHVFWLFIPLPVFWALYDQQVCSTTS